MNRIEIKAAAGSQVVIAFRNHWSIWEEQGPTVWHARVYVNYGETATSIARTFKTEAGLRRWAAKQLAAH